ncbi:substrate-binding domain-containing protein [Pelagibacterium lentulum]|uniref:HTH-type transcriptional regulator AglR n=1 Tax=Pelagibacterium lentulum TaxID=2029865 RepID=A0A916W0C1_9HYPH|nr:substrate-binding domain-containing protein [Pelagibacterium lentulum]GGA56745.1 HTH-type transcriptional regulator AglR [Pelagibacterium lentulum]
MTTLRQLAEHLGLSPATVSRALNGFPEVGAKTRARVIAAAEKFNYRPNLTAKKLATGKSGMVGIIFRAARSLMVDPHFLEYLAGLSMGLAERELDLILRHAPPGAQLQSYERLINSGLVDGLVIAAPELDDPRIAMLMENDFPFVVHGHIGDHPSYAFYDIDNLDAFSRATQLLLALGHRRIAFLNGAEGMAFSMQREAAFQAALAAEGIGVPELFVNHSEMSEDLGYQCAVKWLHEEKAPTAILCSSTLLALGAMRAAGEAGLTVGKDISIIAHDDVLPHLRAEHFLPALTVTRAPIRDAGFALAEMIHRRIDGEAPEMMQTIAPVDLIVRGSTGAVPPDAGEPWL